MRNKQKDKDGNRKQPKSPNIKNKIKKRKESKKMEQYFKKLEVLDDIKNTVENGFLGDINDLHHETFNTGYYVIGYYQAEQALINSDYGVFGAIEKIKEYEEENFGEVDTDLSSAENVANMLYYILGEEVLYNLDFTFENSEITEDNRSEFLEELEELIKEEEEA